jgi:acid phosphatase type 7
MKTHAQKIRYWIVLLMALFAVPMNAVALHPTIVRGPYLQILTQNGVVIRWRTDIPCHGYVEYVNEGRRFGDLQHEAEPTTEHEIVVQGLSPATRYTYAVGSSPETLERTDNYFFITQPAPGAAHPTRIWAIGDSGTGSSHQLAVRDVYYNFTGARPTDVWLALGDNAYPSGTDLQYQLYFFNVYSNLLQNTAIWPTIGNHETYAVPAGQRFPYLDIFTLPQKGEAGGVWSGTEKYYSFNYANIHFVCLDSMTSDRSTNGPMLMWLKEDLMANTNGWLIAYFHHPAYTKGSHNSDAEFELIEMRTNVVPVLESFGVDLVLSGHSHIYERSFLLNGHYGLSTSLEPTMLQDAGSGRPGHTGAYLKRSSGPAANEGAVYVVAGSSGYATVRTGFHPVMYFDELQTGSLVIDVNANRLDAFFLRDTGAINDSFTIIKGAPPEPLRLATIRVSEGMIIARWKSIVGETYRIEQTGNLQQPEWLPLSGDITATGATSSWTNSIPDGPKQFYRVRK